MFTDVVDSTRLWSVDRRSMAASLELHDEIVRSSIERHQGYVFALGGDGFGAAFGRASDAVAAAVDINSALEAAAWTGPALSVRIGLHLGEAEERDANYYGPTVNTAARVADAGHGGQVLLTDAIRVAVGDPLDATMVGDVRFKGIAGTVRVWQIGATKHPPLRSAGRSSLPTAANAVLGRSADVAAVRRLLAEHRVVTIVAAGGIGKTRLAVEVADAEQSRWTDGVHFVDLTDLGANAEVAPVVARALGVEIGADSSADLVRHVADRSLLIVLDNCEHVIDPCADLVEEILRAGGTSGVLATSREWLDIDGEHVYRLRPLDTTGPRSSAVDLFVERARAIEPDFQPDERTLDDIGVLCAHLDGIPLAIELAASRVSVMSPAELSSNLDDRFRLLSGGRRRSRRRTLSATLDWSYDLLGSEQQRIFRGLGAFAGSFDLRAVAAVCDIPPDVARDEVEALYQRSLVTRLDDAPGRFRLLETIKSYAEGRLLDTGEAETIRRGHTDHFAELARVDSVLTATSWAHLSRIVPDRQNLVACADRLGAEGRWDDLAPVLVSIANLSWGEAATILPRLVSCRESITDPELVDWIRMGESYLYMGMADWGRYVETSQALLRSTDARAVAVGHRNIALVLARLRPDAAMARIDRYAELYPEDAGGELARSVRIWRCVVAAHSDDLDTSTTLAQEMLRDPGPILPDLLAWASSVQVLGVAAWLDDRPDDIVAIADAVDDRIDALAAADSGFRHTVAFVRALASVAGSDRDAALTSARQHAADSLAGPNHAESDALILLAELARREGDVDRARELLLGIGNGRGQASALMASRLAAMLGVKEQLDAAFGNHAAEPAWLFDRPRRALVDELGRRGWQRA
jgi:predicted ATPase